MKLGGIRTVTEFLTKKYRWWGIMPRCSWYLEFSCERGDINQNGCVGRSKAIRCSNRWTDLINQGWPPQACAEIPSAPPWPQERNEIWRNGNALISVWFSSFFLSPIMEWNDKPMAPTHHGLIRCLLWWWDFITEFPIILSVINLQLFTATVPYDKKLKRSREQCHESAGTEVVLARSTERDLERYSESKVKNSTGWGKRPRGRYRQI